MVIKVQKRVCNFEPQTTGQPEYVMMYRVQQRDNTGFLEEQSCHDPAQSAST